VGSYIFLVGGFTILKISKTKEPRVNYQNQKPAQDWYYGPKIAPNL
jgi:hypothetical protein